MSATHCQSVRMPLAARVPLHGINPADWPPDNVTRDAEPPKHLSVGAFPADREDSFGVERQRRESLPRDTAEKFSPRESKARSVDSKPSVPIDADVRRRPTRRRNACSSARELLFNSFHDPAPMRPSETP